MGIGVKAAIALESTKDLPITIIITIAHHLTFLPVFYLHERGWYKVTKRLGKLRNIFKAFTYEIILGMSLGGLIIYIVIALNPTMDEPLAQAIDQTIKYTAIKLVMYPIYDRIWK